MLYGCINSFSGIEREQEPGCGQRCCVFLPTAVKQFLIFSSEVAVRGIPFNLSTQEDVIVPVTGNPSFFVGIDFDAKENTIFFSDTSKDMIFKQNINGTGENTLKKISFARVVHLLLIILIICSVELT